MFTANGILIGAQMVSPCLLAFPAFERITWLFTRHLNTNGGYAYTNDIKVRLSALIHNKY